MKVLWFTGTPGLAEEIKGVKGIYGGGWIKSLQESLMKRHDIELGMAFYSRHLSDAFQHEGTSYYPIHVKRPLSAKIKSRIWPSIEPLEDVDLYVEIIRSFKPDIIHVHGTELSFGLFQKIVTEIPTVVSIQGIITVYNHKYYDGIPEIKVNKYTPIVKRISNLSFHYVKKIFELKMKRELEMMSLTKYVIGRTDWDRRVSQILAPNSQYFHNDEIVRSVFYQSEWKNPNNKTFTIYTTNGNNLYKGLETILKAADLLKKNGVDFVWKIAGVSPKDDMVHLSKRLFGLSDTPCIEFLGKLSEKEIVDNLLGCNLYVMPSRIENSPNNLVEAMLLGVPCIATHAGGTDSLITDKKTGCLIQDGDPWSMAGTILDVMKNYSNAQKLGKAGRTLSLERNNPEKICDELFDIYKQLVHIDERG